MGQSDTYGLNLTPALLASAPTSSPQLAPRTNEASIFSIFSEQQSPLRSGFEELPASPRPLTLRSPC